MVPFVFAATAHGPMIINRLDYNTAFNGGKYGVGAQLLERGVYDPVEVGLSKSLIDLRRETHGDDLVVLDGGANIGVMTLEWAKHMDGWGHVVAVEAQERIFYALAGNIAVNNCFNVRAVWAALSDQNGGMLIPEPDYTKASSFGSFELRRRLGTEDIGQAINYDEPNLMVRALTIDAMQFPRLDILKLDIEGMELEALEGAAETIDRCKPALIVEAVKVDGEVLDQKLEEFGYVKFPMHMNVMAMHKDDPGVARISVEKKAA
jgi:FkbM family methyltransferase